MFRFFSFYCMCFQFLLVYQKQRDHAPPSTYKTPKKCHAQYLSTSQINDEISRSHTYKLTQANELDQLAQGMKHNNNVLTQHWAGNPCAAGKHSIFAWPLRVFVSYKNNFKHQFEFAFV